MTAPESARVRYRRSKSEQAELYAKVVQASLRLFAEGGYEAISMRKVAAAVGVAPMSLYRYFPTKAHLVRHLWDAILRDASDAAEARIANERAPLKRLMVFADEYLQYWLDHREHYWVVFCLRDDRGDLHAQEGAYVLRPNPQHFLATLARLVDDCIGRENVQEVERRHLNEALICKSLGFLAGVVGLGTSPWQSVPELKRRMIADMGKQVSEVCAAARTRPPGTAAGHRR